MKLKKFTMGSIEGKVGSSNVAEKNILILVEEKKII
jgi:hypothetical protein